MLDILLRAFGIMDYNPQKAKQQLLKDTQHHCLHQFCNGFGHKILDKESEVGGSRRCPVILLFDNTT